MIDFKKIYATQGERYEQMVSREDYEGNILRALEEIRPCSDQVVVELGAGTGRLTRLLAPLARWIIACDHSSHMLAVARKSLARSGRQNWELLLADNRHLPIAGETADLAIAGWSLGHSVGWYPASWRAEITLALAEMRRILRPGGAIILLETLGTGRETPRPPTPGLEAFYAWLEGELGFQTTWIRTDYRFASPAEGAYLTRFFFGEELAERIRRDELTILPECTGIWWLGI